MLPKRVRLKKGEYEFRTFTNFNQEGRREVLRNHSSEETALRAWPSIIRIYNKLHNYRVWIEDKHGNIIKEINPNNKVQEQV
jgi:hypothetical protein